MLKSKLITIDGVDGSGKSTHIHCIVEALKAAGHDVVLTREPGGTPLSERLREMVLHETMDVMTEAFLVFAARREHLTQVIVPALKSGKVVVCDRFTDATFAYQGYGRGFSLAMLSMLEQKVQSLHGLGLECDGSMPSHSGCLQPSLTFLFDLDPQIAAGRLAAARQADRFESQDLQFFQRVRAGYQARMAQQPERFVLIDASQSIAAVEKTLLAAMVLNEL